MALLVDHQALDLMKHRRMGLVGVAAVGTPGDDHPDRRLLREHRPDLHRRRMGAQQHARAVRLGIEIERVVHIPRGVTEVIVVGLYVGPFGDRESHVGEDRGQLVGDLAHRMDAAGLGGRLAHRQGDVERLGVQARGERGVLERGAARGERGVDAVLNAVDRRPLLLALLRRHPAERLQQFGDGAFLAERRDAHGFERRFVGRAFDRADDLAFKLFEIGHFHPRVAGCAGPARKRSSPASAANPKFA